MAARSVVRLGALALVMALTGGVAAPVADLVERRAAGDASDQLFAFDSAAAQEIEGAFDPLDDAFLRLSSEDATVSARANREIVEAWRDSGSASLDLLILRGERALARQNFERAERHFSQVVNLAPEYAFGWALRAGVRYRSGDYGLALGDIAQALRLEPRQFEALLLASLIYLETDAPEKALAAARAALELNPHLEEAQNVIDLVKPEVEGVDA